MARKRRHKTTSKSTPAVIVAVLIFGGDIALFRSDVVDDAAVDADFTAADIL
ncbi:hypothetical protein J2X71_001848 [Rhizobium sp. 1399]|jgi:hypothetical protein|nr:hypothetical protein [Rhizobium sp. 1399]